MGVLPSLSEAMHESPQPSAVPALSESFWSSMQNELLDQRGWSTRVELATAMFGWIEAFYNPARRHSVLGYLSPAEPEELLPRTRSRHDDLQLKRLHGTPGYVRHHCFVSTTRSESSGLPRSNSSASPLVACFEFGGVLAAV